MARGVWIKGTFWNEHLKYSDKFDPKSLLKDHFYLGELARVKVTKNWTKLVFSLKKKPFFSVRPKQSIDLKRSQNVYFRDY